MAQRNNAHAVSCYNLLNDFVDILQCSKKMHHIPKQYI